MEIFRQDVFWKELLIEKRECSEKMLNLRRKRVAGEREDEVLAMKKKLQEIVECLKGRKELLRKDEEFNFEGRMKEWLKKSGEKEKEEKKEVVVVGGEEQDDFFKGIEESFTFLFFRFFFTYRPHLKKNRRTPEIENRANSADNRFSDVST